MSGLTEIKAGVSPQTASIKSNLNIVLNISGYLLNLATSYLGGVAGWFGGVSNAELSSKYQTLITPSSTYFGYIWGLIFLCQGFFAVAQLLPKFRDHPLVQKGINFVYFLVCVAQAAWTICFGYELMISAFVAMIALLLSLMTILKMQWAVVEEEEKKATEISNMTGTLDTENNENAEYLSAPFPRLPYWLLRFPFALHAGWIAPATPLMLSVLLVSKNVSTNIELWVAVLGVAMLFGMCMGLLLRHDSGAPAYVFPGTVAYAFIGIMWELNAPSDAILARHDESSINLVKNVTGFSGVFLLITMMSRWVALLLRDQMCKRKEDDDESEGIGYIEASTA